MDARIGEDLDNSGLQVGKDRSWQVELSRECGFQFYPTVVDSTNSFQLNQGMDTFDFSFSCEPPTNRSKQDARCCELSCAENCPAASAHCIYLAGSPHTPN